MKEPKTPMCTLEDVVSGRRESLAISIRARWPLTPLKPMARSRPGAQRAVICGFGVGRGLLKCYRRMIYDESSIENTGRA